ncbi:PE-PGRS family protein [Yinghuangia sp. YIM S09857]|uniref:PE-PGRS family protein n=1 Tax=Yinghuangia sp. YIM S09857 TaxID=3436929 RepID=UPI003F53E4D0
MSTGCGTAATVGTVSADAAIDADLLAAAFTVREAFGRVNDVIHATAIASALPRILDPGEAIRKRPSLAAGNDPSRPFDLETDKRVAEFKLARWAGADATRKRATFKDLMMLASDTSGRRAQLFVLGSEPARFLRTTRSTARWALKYHTGAASLFEERFGPLSKAIAEFTRTHAAHVEITDLRGIVPLPPGIAGHADL